MPTKNKLMTEMSFFSKQERIFDLMNGKKKLYSYRKTDNAHFKYSTPVFSVQHEPALSAGCETNRGPTYKKAKYNY